jgi:hypothetical protein
MPRLKVESMQQERQLAEALLAQPLAKIFVISHEFLRPHQRGPRLHPGRRADVPGGGILSEAL